MNLLEALAKIEPNPLLTSPLEPFMITYYAYGKWFKLDNLSLWELWYHCKTAIVLDRPLRVWDAQKGEGQDFSPSHLNLFSLNTLSGRTK